MRGHTYGTGTIARGYRKIYVDGKQVPEHRHIMEQHIGRKLLPFPIEIIHHKNGIKLDNRIENLEIMSASLHHSHHARKCRVTPTHKSCTQCNRMLLHSRFFRISANNIKQTHNSTVNFLQAVCKKCSYKNRATYMKAYRKKHRLKLNAQIAEWKRKHRIRLSSSKPSLLP